MSGFSFQFFSVLFSVRLGIELETVRYVKLSGVEFNTRVGG